MNNIETQIPKITYFKDSFCFYFVCCSHSLPLGAKEGKLYETDEPNALSYVRTNYCPGCDALEEQKLKCAEFFKAKLK